jgi:hypothetical protein
MQISSIALLFAVIFVASVTSRSYRKARALRPPYDTQSFIPQPPPIYYKLCPVVGAPCSASNDCCPQQCVSETCCGLSGDKGCQMGKGNGGVGGCCSGNHCQWIDQAKNTTKCFVTLT